MSRYRVQFDVQVRDGLNQEEAEDWIRFEIKASAQLSIKNPLQEDLIPESNSVRIEKVG